MVDYDEMARQHESMLADADRLELLIASPPKNLSSERLRELLLNDAESLRQDLARHFAYEEEGGYLVVVLDARPGLERRVEKLRAQHGEIMRGLGAVLGGPKDASVDDIRPGLRAVLGLLREHEAAETALVHETVVQDEGTPD